MTAKILPLSLLCGAMLLSLAPAAQAQWKWRDADGRVQYSDRPPPGHVAEKDILARPSASALRAMSAPAAAASAPASAAAPGKSASDAAKAEKERKAAEDKRRAEQNAENCRQAQDQLKMLESGIRIRQTNDKGEAVVLDDAARQTQMKQAQTVISVSCK
ncbi:DUF4124 domain-containing protein [Roseateles depolymerans]|uniref:Membrane protein n=1 Tax=Roseateles depolymerans TaxID=76731 RepID=A0A0U3MHC2_9BURK|nr:DUF4124 domain-containing protein [Roseateles depolymerans]ALV07817.1 membrane protein [Roseateles depolymerans]REG21962.1 uncharacterized protein DUF4124 [Roseateles depolymerans]